MLSHAQRSREEKPDVKLSKFLSFICRHGAEGAGLEVHAGKTLGTLIKPFKAGSGCLSPGNPRALGPSSMLINERKKIRAALE